VYDAAVVPALMTGDAVLFLDQQETQMRRTPRDFERDCQAHDATADDDYVVPGIGHEL
jgi:hypothetical protein